MIDPNFLEFWGNYLIAVARGQKQLEDMTRWMSQGFQGLEDLTVTFKKCYGLEQLQPNSPAFTEAWKRATADFRKSFRKTFGLLGWVPQEEHQKLAEENQRLQQKVEQQENAIRRMRMLLDEKGLDQTRTLEAFQDLIKKQSSEFEKLMRNIAGSTEHDD